MTDSGGPALEQDEALRKQLDEIEREDGVPDERSRLLLWLLRNYYNVEDLDSFGFVMDQPQLVSGLSVDAAVVDTSDPEHPRVVLVDAKSRLGRTATSSKSLTQLISAWTSLLARPGDILPSLASDRRFRSIFSTAGLGRDVSFESVRFTAALLFTQDVGTVLRQRVADEPRLAIFDLYHLRRLAAALDGPQPVAAELHIGVADGELLQTSVGDTDVYVCPVSALDIAEWPGIDSRELFDLNVRFDLGKNRVRDSLEQSLHAEAEHSDFLAYHNGITVICNSIDRTETGIIIHDLSVVNGAQTVMALRAARDSLTPSLRLLAKFVVTGVDSQLAREVAVRSNMQNPVTPRNWRALDNQQLRLQAEVADLDVGYEYVTRPDSKRRPGVPIHNDEAAQLLCSVYNERPWLAVKRSSLFNPANYRLIFNAQVTGAHVVLCQRIREAVERSRPEYSGVLLGAWRLSALTATFLIGQLIRVEPHGLLLLEAPETALRDDATETGLATMASFVSAFLSGRVVDAEFKVAFKNEKFLRNLAAEARSAWLQQPRSVTSA